ncbi:hypothetical protein A6A07_12640 [Streptomyces sp. CB03911]|nr:hypothetical protein A6A07_12640 [Streptomyces sp. CB03911]
MRTTVPVAVACPAQVEAFSIWVRTDWYWSVAWVSWIAWPVGAMLVFPVRAPAYRRLPKAMVPSAWEPPRKSVLPVLMSTLPPTVTWSVPSGGGTREPPPTTPALKMPPPSLSMVRLPSVTILPSASAARWDTRK